MWEGDTFPLAPGGKREGMDPHPLFFDRGGEGKKKGSFYLLFQIYSNGERERWYGCDVAHHYENNNWKKKGREGGQVVLVAGVERQKKELV